MGIMFNNTGMDSRTRTMHDRRSAMGIQVSAYHELAPESVDALYALVERIQSEPPYSYQGEEIPPARVWFAHLLERATVALVAVQHGVPATYCVGLPLELYGKLAPLYADLGVAPESTMYLAELGVDRRARRAGLATALVRGFHAAHPVTTAYLVRTLAGNEPAVTLYQRLGYQLLDVQQEWNGRNGVFLRRPWQPVVT